MDFSIKHRNTRYIINTEDGIDISLPISNGSHNPSCFYSPFPLFKPLMKDGFVGSVAQGGAVNFYQVVLYPHGHGTHTECVGHILSQPVFITNVLKSSLFVARLISVYPQILDNGDQVITQDSLGHMNTHDCQALIIRTLPNHNQKKTLKYSDTNPPYFSVNAIMQIVQSGIKHLLVDIPSVDKEKDGGNLKSHNSFWHAGIEDEKTITELVFIPDQIQDGLYLLNLQIISLKLDVSPSKPVLYKLKTE